MKLWKIFIATLAVVLFLSGCNSPEFTSAKVYLGQRDLDQAEEWFLKALETEPTNSEVPFMLGAHVYKDQKKWEQMNVMFNRSLAIDNRFEKTITGIRHTEWQNIYNKGANAYNEFVGSEEKPQETLNLAIKVFNIALTIDPTEILTYGILATCYLLSEDIENAKIYFQKAIDMDPQDEVNYKSLSGIYLNEENYDAALDIIQKARKIDPQNADLAQQMANIYYNTDKKDLALQTFQEALNLNPDNFDLIYNIGIMYYQAKDFSAATPWFEKAYEKIPDDLEIIKLLVNCYQKLEDLKNVETYAKKALEIEPDSRTLIMALYKSLLDQGKGDSEEVKNLLKKLDN